MQEAVLPSLLSLRSTTWSLLSITLLYSNTRQTGGFALRLGQIRNARSSSSPFRHHRPPSTQCFDQHSITKDIALNLTPSTITLAQYITLFSSRSPFSSSTPQAHQQLDASIIIAIPFSRRLIAFIPRPALAQLSTTLVP